MSICVVHLCCRFDIWNPTYLQLDTADSKNDLLWEHLPYFFVGQKDLMHWVELDLKGSRVNVEVRRYEDFGVPNEALAGGQVGNQAGRPIRIAYVDDGALLLAE